MCIYKDYMHMLCITRNHLHIRHSTTILCMHALNCTAKRWFNVTSEMKQEARNEGEREIGIEESYERNEKARDRRVKFVAEMEEQWRARLTKSNEKNGARFTHTLPHLHSTSNV